MTAVILSLFAGKAGKYILIGVAALALIGAAWGYVHASNARAVAEDRAKEVAAQAVADAATYQRNIAALQQAADAAQARATALASTHQRIANAPATACAAAPAAIRAAILRPDAAGPAPGHP